MDAAAVVCPWSSVSDGGGEVDNNKNKVGPPRHDVNAQTGRYNSFGMST